MRSIMFIVALLNLVMGLQPINIAVIAKTDGRDHANSDNSPYLKLNIGGNWRQVRFPDLPGDDYMKHKSDWFEWPAHQFYGFNDLDDLVGIRIRAGGNDGWCYEDVSIFIEDENNNWHAVAIHHEINHWIDGNGDNASRERTISMNVAQWKQCLATGPIKEVQLFALTEGTSYAGSDDAARVIIETSTGQSEEITLSNLDGDDYLENKSDWWKFGWSRSYSTTQITGISLRSGGSDGWNPARAMVVFKTLNTNNNYQYQVAAFTRNIGWLDDRSSQSLNLTPCPFEYTDTIGYWGKYASGNGGPSSHHTISYSFQRMEANSQSDAQAVEHFRSTTHGQTVGVETGLEFDGFSASSKVEHSIENTNSFTKRREVENAISQTLAHSTTYEHEAVPPVHIPAGEHYTLYVWNVFRKSNYGEGANLISFDYVFKWGPCRDVYPNCVSSSQCADVDCMTCSTSDAIIDQQYTDVRLACRPVDPQVPEVPRCQVSTRDWSCCTWQNPCGIGEGDCDRDSHCQGDLVCRHNTHGYFDTCGPYAGRRSLKNVEHRRLIDKQSD